MQVMGTMELTKWNGNDGTCGFMEQIVFIKPAREARGPEGPAR